MIIIFDLDGVLVDARDIHYECLNQAIAEEAGSEFVITRDEHISTYDGLPTDKKLDMLSESKGLPKDSHRKIWARKQELTRKRFENLPPDPELAKLIKEIKNIGIKIYCVSNSIHNTVQSALISLGIQYYFDGIYGNDDVDFPKPSPSAYLLCMATAGVGVKETLIVEDSPLGREAALASGAHTLFIANRHELTPERIFSAIDKMNQKPVGKYKNDKLNILIPMAGGGTRFTQMGYTFPKPLIEVNQKPMIQCVVESLNIDANYIYIAQLAHYQKFTLKYMLNLITPKCKIVTIDGITEGAACTTLLATQYIDNDNPLIIANSDQIIDWNPTLFMHMIDSDKLDGGILTFKNTHPKWSYAKVGGESGYVHEVQEKMPISDNATVGVYYWRRGSDYVKYAKQMIQKNKRVNNEFYVCPVFNEAINDGKKFKIFPVNEMWGLGTPEDLERYLSK